MAGSFLFVGEKYVLQPKVRREIVDVGVDYITATATTKEGKRAFERIGQWELSKEAARGNSETTYTTPFMRGIKCGSAEFAYSEDWLMLRLSSHIAKERWCEVVSHSSNVSRIDLQATVRFTPSLDNLAELVERQMIRFKKERNRKLEIELRRNDVKGKTLYSGSRKSDLFSRLYDKGKESKLADYAGCWRLENQFGNRPAKAIASELLRQPEPASYIAHRVADYYSKRGAVVVNSKRVLIVGKLPSVFHRNSPSHYKWLEAQVRPTITREVSRGNLHLVLDALGITDDQLAFHLDKRREEKDLCHSTPPEQS